MVETNSTQGRENVSHPIQELTDATVRFEQAILHYLRVWPPGAECTHSDRGLMEDDLRGAIAALGWAADAVGLSSVVPHDIYAPLYRTEVLLRVHATGAVRRAIHSRLANSRPVGLASAYAAAMDQRPLDDLPADPFRWAPVTLGKYELPPDLQGPWDLFLSYSHPDSIAVRALYECLTREGLHVWLDQTHLGRTEGLPPTHVDTRIRAAMANSRKVLLCTSNEWVALGGYSQFEVLLATGDPGDPQAVPRPLFITRLDTTPLPASLAHVPTADWFESHGIARILHLLENSHSASTRPVIPDRTTLLRDLHPPPPPSGPAMTSELRRFLMRLRAAKKAALEQVQRAEWAQVVTTWQPVVDHPMCHFSHPAAQALPEMRYGLLVAMGDLVRSHGHLAHAERTPEQVANPEEGYAVLVHHVTMLWRHLRTLVTCPPFDRSGPLGHRMSVARCHRANCDYLDALRWVEHVWFKRWSAEMMASTASEGEEEARSFESVMRDRTSEVADRVLLLQRLMHQESLDATPATSSGGQTGDVVLPHHLGIEDQDT